VSYITNELLTLKEELYQLKKGLKIE
jgi:hypothetical protein